MTITPAQLAKLGESPTFQVKVVPTDLWWSLLGNQDVRLPWHDTVLRPLLRHAVEAWAYELPEGSEVRRSAGDLVGKAKGKFAIDLAREPIRGHELFWNASGGKRGSIVIVLPRTGFPADDVFAHCHKVLVVGNPSIAHTASALRFARAKVAGEQAIVCVFSRNNGFEFFDIHAPREDIVPLFALAKSLVPGSQNADPP